jgi:hypothetical protein
MMGQKLYQTIAQRLRIIKINFFRIILVPTTKKNFNQGTNISDFAEPVNEKQHI